MLPVDACVAACPHSCLFVCFSCIAVPFSLDGLMVQVTVDTMVEIRRSLREMKDYTVTCGRLDQPESRELVCLQWMEEKCTVNRGLVLPPV